MVGTMLSKSLTQFSVHVWSCAPSLLFTWGQTMVEVMKIMLTSLQRSQACTATVCALNPADCGSSLTHAFARDSWTPTSKSPVGSLFLSLGPWCTRLCCALQESISQSYVSSGSSIVGLMVTSSKRAYAIHTPRAPVPAQTTADLYLHRR